MRRILFWLHLGAGVVAGAVVLVMSITGVALTYEAQWVEWAERRAFPVSAPSQPLTPAALLERARLGGASAFGAFDPATLAFQRREDAPVVARAGADRLYLDPYTGAVLGTAAPATAEWVGRLRAWHRWLGQEGDGRALGRALTGACNLAFLFLVLSGMVLWVPRRWSAQHVRAVLWFRRGLRGKARDFNWHHVLGIWSAVPLVLIVASGAVISYRWAGDLVYRALGEEPPGRSAPAPARSAGSATAADPQTGGFGAEPAGRTQAGAALDRAFRAATAHEPTWRTLTLPVPSPPGAEAIDVRLSTGARGQPSLARTLHVEASTGRILSETGFGDGSPGRRARSFLRFAHTGEYWGVWGQTVAGLVSLASVVLVWTGLALALRRLARALQRRRGSAHPAAAEPSTVPGASAPANPPRRRRRERALR